MGASLPAAFLLAALPIHVVPFHAPEPSRAAQAANGGSPTCTGVCNLQYFGGHVISNVKAYAVFWGSGVDPAIQSGIGDFFTALTNSEWMDWQNEYRTDITPAGGGTGTGQLIGRGTFAGPAIAIAPSSSASCAGRSLGHPLLDTAIQSELAAQIDGGVLPPPDENTLYMLYFPPGCVISDGTNSSCVSGGFCAYHSTLTRAGRSVFYGVMPDFGQGSGCDLGCGRGTTFQNVCSASSHELGEAMTDAEAGLASAFAPPLGWYDKDNGENGDMCNQVSGSIISLTDGTTAYTVQQMYSQKTGLCQQSRTDPNDFEVFMNPNVAAVAAGGSTIVPVTTAATSGSPGTLRLALGQLPAGVTGTFDATTVTPGQSTNLRLSASASAASARDSVVVVIACAGSGTCPSPGVAAHTASLLLQVAGLPPNDFSISVTPPAVTALVPGQTIQYGVGTAVTSGLPESIALAVSGLPAGVTGTFDASPIVTGGTATLTLAASAGAAPASPTTFTVKGTSASVPAGHASTAQVAVHGLPSVDLSVSGGVSGIVPLTATAVAGAGTTLASLSIAIDGHQASSRATSPLSFSWDTTALPNGTHAVVATAVDADGGTRSTQASVALANDFSIALAPATAIATIGGPPATFTISTGFIRGAETIALLASGLPSGLQPSFDRSSIVAGSSATLTLTAAAGAARGRTAFSVSGTTQSNPGGRQATASVLLIAPPSAAIVAPAAATVSGKVSIEVNATADAEVGISRLQVKDGETVLGSGSSPTLSVAWDTTLVPDGVHTLSATVLDGAGNSMTTPVVSVRVANGGGCSSGGSSGMEAVVLLTLLALWRVYRAPGGSFDASTRAR